MRHSSTIVIAMWLMAASLLISPACAYLEIGLETASAPTPMAPATESELGGRLPPAAEAAPATPVVDAAAATQWIEVWNEKDGYGLAVPCWWVVYPAPTEGLYER